MHLSTKEKTTADIDQEAYDRGFQDGLRAYAINKDGKQYVGSCGTTLQKALEERSDCWSYTPF